MPLDPILQAARDRRCRDGVAPLYTLSVAQARAADLAAIRAGAGPPEPVHEVADLTIEGPACDAAGPGLPAVRRGRVAGAGLLLRRRLDPGQPRHLRRGVPGLVQRGRLRRGLRRLPVGAGAEVSGRGAGLLRRPGLGGRQRTVLRWRSGPGGGRRRQCGRQPRRRGRADGPGERCGPDLAGQLLVYPNTDYLAETASLRESTDDAMFNRTSVAWYWSNYLGTPEDGANPLASPLRATDLSGLPSALIITAEFDPLA